MRERCHVCWNLVCTCSGVPDWGLDDEEGPETVYTAPQPRPRFLFFENVVARFISLAALLWAVTLLSPAFAPGMTDILIVVFAYTIIAGIVTAAVVVVYLLLRTLFFGL